MTVRHFRTCQEARLGIDAARLIIEIEFGQRSRQIQVDFKKRSHRADFGSITKERIAPQSAAAERVRNEVLPEIMGAAPGENVYQ